MQQQVQAQQWSGAAPAQHDGAALIRDALSDGMAHAAEMHRHALETATAFRAGGERKALGLYIEFLNGFDSLAQLLDCTARALGIDFAVTPFGASTVTRFVEELNALLSEAMKAQERKDWVLLADLLEYELAPHLESWQKLFVLLGEQVPAA